MSKWDNCPIILDVSHYNQGVDVAKLKSHGVAGIIAKCGDGYQMKVGDQFDVSNYVDEKFAGYCQQAYDASLPFGAYFFYRPDLVQAEKRDDDFQFRVLKYALQNKKVDFLALDLEVGGDTASNIRDKVEKFICWMEDYFQKPVIIYTAMWYLNNSIKTWPRLENGNYDLWLAQWIYQQKATDWASLKLLYPSDSVKVVTPGFATFKIWQWATFYGLDGIDGEVDFNFWNGDLASFHAWAKFEASDPVNPVEPGEDDDDEQEPPIVDDEFQARVITLLERIDAKLASIDIGVSERPTLRDMFEELLG